MRYQFDLTCPICGADVTHQASGNTAVLDTRAVAVCAQHGEMLVVAQLVPLGRMDRRGAPRRPPGTAGCGTEAGFQAHRRNGTPVDPACREAHNAYARERRAKVRRTA